MMKPRKRPGAVKVAHIPEWVRDVANQNEWNERFIGILKRDYESSDVAISAMLRDERLSKVCATKIRSYVDRDCTIWLYEQRRARGVLHKKQLETAIAGLRAAIDLCVNRGNQERAMYVGVLVDEFSKELERGKQAFATRRHGRDRDHGILFECHSFLQTKMQQPLTYVTLANLVNAGFEADGDPSKKLVTEEELRKNLANFKRINPLWHLYSSTR